MIKDGFESYPLSWVVGQNLFFIIYFGIGFIGMLSLETYGVPSISLIYLLFLFIMLVFVLRKHLCTNCYYYGKRCNTGWGKLASYLFKEKSGDYKLGVKLAGITWMFAAVIPIIGMIFILLINFSNYILILLLLFIMLSFLNFLVHSRSCSNCKMRDICPASMVKR